MKILTNKEIIALADKLADKIYNETDHFSMKIYGVPRGGIPVAYLVHGLIEYSSIVDFPEEADLIVDDIIDSGKTKARYAKYDKPFYSLLENQKEWIHFPWEDKDKGTPIDDNIIRIQQYLEDNKDEKVIAQLQKIIDET